MTGFSQLFIYVLSILKTDIFSSEIRSKTLPVFKRQVKSLYNMYMEENTFFLGLNCTECFTQLSGRYGRGILDKVIPHFELSKGNALKYADQMLSSQRKTFE